MDFLYDARHRYTKYNQSFHLENFCQKFEQLQFVFNREYYILLTTKKFLLLQKTKNIVRLKLSLNKLFQEYILNLMSLSSFF